MARFAFFPFLPFVLIVLPVAGITIGLQLLLIRIPFVAADAFHFMMFSKKRILGCLVVIEQDFFPSPIRMASFTFRPKVALVFVILLVTLDTKFRRVFETGIKVASLAFQADVLAKHLKMGFSMVEMDRLPVLLFMAVLAFGPQCPLVLVILQVATTTGCRSLAIFLVRQMAIPAKYFAGQMAAL